MATPQTPVDKLVKTAKDVIYLIQKREELEHNAYANNALPGGSYLAAIKLAINKLAESLTDLEEEL